MKKDKFRCLLSTVLAVSLLSFTFTALAAQKVMAKEGLEKCTCKFKKELERVIEDDEFLKKRYSEQAERIQKKIEDYKAMRGGYPDIIANKHMDEFSEWAKGLQKEFKEARGYPLAITLHPDPKNPSKIDKQKLEEYKKHAACQEIYAAAIAHEKYHINMTKEIEAGQKKLESAADIAREEVEAYEKGLEILRRALEEAKKDCQWKCKFTQEVFYSLEECRKHCEENKPRGLHIATRGICYKKDPRTGEWKGMGY